MPSVGLSPSSGAPTASVGDAGDPFQTRTSEIRRIAASSVGPPASRLLRYGLPFTVWVAMLATTVLLEPYVGRANFAFMWPAVLFAAWYAGFPTAFLTAI